MRGERCLSFRGLKFGEICTWRARELMIPLYFYMRHCAQKAIVNLVSVVATGKIVIKIAAPILIQDDALN